MLLFRYEFDHIGQAVNALLGQGRSEENRGVLEEGQFPSDIFFELMARLAVLFNEIPLVDDDDAALARFVDVAGDFRILFGNAFRRIDDQDGDIRAVDGAKGADDAVPFDRHVDLGLAAHARRIDEDEVRSFIGPVGIDGIARRTRYVADDDPVLPQEGIGQGRFADVRPADEGNMNRIVVVFKGRNLFNILQDFIEEVAEVHQVDG